MAQGGWRKLATACWKTSNAIVESNVQFNDEFMPVVSSRIKENGVIRFEQGDDNIEMSPSQMNALVKLWRGQ